MRVWFYKVVDSKAYFRLISIYFVSLPFRKLFNTSIPFRLFVLLACSKIIFAFSTHITREWFLLHGAPASVVAFGVLGGSGLLLLTWQNFMGNHRTLVSMKWPKIAFYTLIFTAQIYFWFIGLSRLKSTRFVMLTQYADLWSVSFIAYLIGNNSSSTFRGLNFIILTVILSFIVDCTYILIDTPTKSTTLLTQDTEVLGKKDLIENDSIKNLIIGYICILGSIGLSGYKRTLGKKLAADVGGNRRLFAISVPLGALMISPLAFVQYLVYATNYTGNINSTIILFGGLGIGLVIFDYFVGHSVSIQASTISHVSTGWPVSIASVILWDLVWFHGELSILDIILCVIMYIGIYNLILSDAHFAAETQFPSPGIGGRTFELPLHNSFFLRGSGTSESIGIYFKMILDNGDSRQIFYFLLLNMGYMFVQVIYGIWTNSLGLISDAIHMFFDCMALAVGLFASIMSKWSENNKFTYGYGRIETLSGFANGVFLILVSIFIVFEAIGRLFEPPEMNTDKLLLVSFVGLIVNLIGIFAFNHGHHGHSHGSCQNHTHDKDQNSHNHHHHHDHHRGDHHHHHHHHGDNANMEGIYLHILADTLGSIGVIVSTILIQKFGWTGFDPLASLLIAGLIFTSVMPLIKHSASVLMLSVSGDLERAISEGLHELLHVPNINSYTMPRFWPNDAECIIGSIHVQTTDEADEQTIISEVTKILKSHIIGLEELTVQVEKTNGFQGCLCNYLDSNGGSKSVIATNRSMDGHSRRKDY